jgi:hypothetical protein
MRAQIGGCDLCGIQGTWRRGAALEQQIQEQLRRSSMRLIGPNCLGIMNPAIGLNATFAKDAPKGNVAFLSQSGALLTQFSTGATANKSASAPSFPPARCWMSVGAI